MPLSDQQIAQLEKELAGYRYDGGSGRRSIQREVAEECLGIAQCNGDAVTAEEISQRFRLKLVDTILVERSEVRPSMDNLSTKEQPTPRRKERNW